MVMAESRPRRGVSKKKYCPGCRKELLLLNFPRDWQQPDGRQERCRYCRPPPKDAEGQVIHPFFRDDLDTSTTLRERIEEQETEETEEETKRELAKRMAMRDVCELHFRDFRLAYAKRLEELRVPKTWQMTK